MIVLTILGTSADSTEEQLRAITSQLEALCAPTEIYVAFPMDRMQMDLGKEIVVQVAGYYRRNAWFVTSLLGILKTAFVGAKVRVEMMT